MSAALTKQRSGHKYPGLRDAVQKLIHGKPNHLWSIAELSKSFQGKSEAIIAYHVRSLREGGLVEMPKGGFYRALNKPPIDHEAVRQHVQLTLETKPSVVAGPGWTHGTAEAIKAVIPIETKWTAYLERHVRSIQKRMRSKMPADEVFTEEDRSLLDQLFIDITKEAKAYLGSQNGYKPKES